jgi:hypothetical protein
MWWVCDCGLWLESDPTGWHDWGGVPVAEGPLCPDCGVPMDYDGEE